MQVFQLFILRRIKLDKDFLLHMTDACVRPDGNL